MAGKAEKCRTTRCLYITALVSNYSAFVGIYTVKSEAIFEFLMAVLIKILVV
jgi:hypothetical protein